jgi:hypothetical protein
MTEGSNLFIKPKTSSNTAYTLRVNALVIRDMLPSVATSSMSKTLYIMVLRR